MKLLRRRAQLTDQSATVGGLSYAVQARGNRHRGFWHHHFLRARTLRRMFLRSSLEGSGGIGDVLLNPWRAEMAQRAGLGRWRRPRLERELFSGTALVPEAPMARLAEPLIDGHLTTNGVAALRRLGCEIPPYPTVDIERVYE